MGKQSKYLYILFIFISLNKLYSQTGWFWLNPLPTGNHLNSIKFPDRQNTVIAGNAGTILKSSNGGANWLVMNSNSSYNLNSVFFVNQNTGYAAGFGGTIIKTTNAGIDWQQQFSLLPQTARLNSLYFTSPDTGFAAGFEEYPFTQTYILKTTNGGQSWTVITFGTEEFSSLSFTNSLTGYAAGGKIYKTTNAGLSWVVSLIPNDYLTSIYFTNSNTGYAGGYFGLFYKTIDGGNSWSNLSIGSIPEINSIYFINPNTGFIASDNSILKTKDGAKNWEEWYHPLVNLEYLYSISFADSLNGIASGQYGLLYKTSNQGTNWDRLSSGTTVNMSDVVFVNENTGFITADSGNGRGIIFKTINGGINWTYHFPNSNNGLNSIDFINANTGYAVGGNPEVYKTTDGGENWITISLKTTQHPHVITFLNETTGFIGTSFFGVILKTTNSGLSWDSIFTNFGTIQSIKFTDTNTGYLLDNLIYKSTNSGLNWETIFGDTDYTIRGMDFINSNAGYAVGSRRNGNYSSIILMTSNGGINWALNILDSIQNPVTIKFWDTYTGYICAPGYGGGIVKTTNGGINWFKQNSNCNDAGKLFFTSQNTGYAIGGKGTIIKTVSGGEPIGISKITSEIPSQFLLFQNYPNPFNPTTKIRYRAAKTGLVSIIIFDILGKQLTELVNQIQRPGEYETEFNANNLSSGIYFYRMNADNFIETKKMILIK